MSKNKNKEFRSSYPRRSDDKKRIREQKNIIDQKDVTIREAIRQIDLAQEEVRNNVIANVESILLPIVQKLEINNGSRHYIQLLRNNLQEMASAFGTKLSDGKTKLTSREIEICVMIRNGLTNKEIAMLLNVTIRTTEKHRAHIRKKLCIKRNDSLPLFLKEI